MCGIAAIFAYHYAAPEADREELRRMRDFMRNRGPDGAGEWYSGDGRVGLGHRRLAIIDLSEKAAQPMSNQDGTVVLIFNGEIYNYRELRSNLEKKGHRFRSQSDTEVILQLYEEKGEAMLPDLRGMFAFILWDGQKKKMLLARDPYGIKPLYYADDGWSVRMASQVKALLAGGKVSNLPEPAGVVGFFLTGSVPEPFTLYQEIREVPAGSFVWVNQLGPSVPKKYFSLAEIFTPLPFSRAIGSGRPERAANRRSSKPSSPPKGARRERNMRPSPLWGEGRVRGDVVHEALLDSVRHHFVADVPVGIFLSGGIDSGSLVGLAHEAGIQNLQTVTLAFEEFQGSEQDEAPLAEATARLYGTKHTTRRLSQREFHEELPRIFEAMDQPSIDGVNTYFVAKAAKELGLKVSLSGLGGDELFGGYPSFQDIPRMVKIAALPSRIPLLADAFRGLCCGILRGGATSPLHPKFPGLLKYGGTYAGAYFLKRGLFMPWELPSILGSEMAHEGLSRLHLLKQIEETLNPDPGTPFGRVATLESSLYMRNQLLRDADWAGMAHSLEIRTPLVDSDLLKKIAPFLMRPTPSPNPLPLLGREGKGEGDTHPKRFLIRSLNPPLPMKVTQRPKSGFTIPIEKWLDEKKDGTPWARRWAQVVMGCQQGTHEVLEAV